MHDALFVGSTEDEWTVVRLDRAYGCALDVKYAVNVPEQLRPEEFFSGRT